MKRFLSIFLCLCLLASIAPAALAAKPTFSDMPDEGYWSHEALTAAVENGLLKGHDGKLEPESYATRAQLAAIIVRAFGAQDSADLSAFKDLTPADWYYGDMAKAVYMGAFKGDSDNALHPQESATRQETFCVIARALNLSSENFPVLDAFTDGGETAAWAKAEIAALVEGGCVHGSDGSLKLEDSITLEELAQLLHNIIKSYISSSGSHTGSFDGSVMINSPDVELKNAVIHGDLIIGDGVGSGDVTLDNTKITGRLVARGGGENSIHIKNGSEIESLVVAKTGFDAIRIVTEDGCRIEIVRIAETKAGVVLEGAFNKVIIAADTPTVLKNATVAVLEINTGSADVSITGKSAVSTLIAGSAASNSSVRVDSGAKVSHWNVTGDNLTIKDNSRVAEVDDGPAPIAAADLFDAAPVAVPSLVRVVVSFKVDMDEASAASVSNYELKNNGTDVLAISSVELTDAKTAVLTLTNANKLTNNTTAKLTVKAGIKTQDGRVLGSDAAFDVSVDDDTTPAVDDITVEKVGDKALKLTFTEPVYDGINISVLDVNNFTVFSVK